MQFPRAARCLVTLIALLVAPAAQAANLLFQSDFGGTVHMLPPVYGAGATNGWWPVAGGDDGFSWPIVLNGKSAPGFQPISYGPTIAYDPTTATLDCGGSPCWKVEVIGGTRHDGTTGAILHQQNFQNIYWQLPYIVSPGSDVTDEYQLLWIKFPANFAQQMGPNSWRVLSEWKDAGENCSTCPINGYRISVDIYTDSNGTPYWDMHGDNNPAGTPFWELTSHTPVPVGQWFKYEWAWHRTHDNTSWSKVWVNGQLIMDQEGGGSISTGFYVPNASYPINRIFVAQMYGAAGPAEQWLDHVEIWDGVPGTPAAGPTVPTNLAGVAVSPSQVNLTWTASTDPNGIAGYDVYRNGTQISKTATTTYSDTGLTPGTTYSYAVAAYDSAGAVSAQSAPVSVTVQTAAASITTSATTVAPGGVLVANVSNGPGDTTDWIGLYPVSATFDYALGTHWSYMNCTQTPPTTSIKNVACNFTAWPTTGQYEFRLYNAATLALAAKSATVTVGTSSSAPSVPTGLGLGTLGAWVSWGAATGPNGIAGYNVYRNGAKIGSSTTTSYHDTGLTAGTTYSYTVSAFDSLGHESAQSAAISLSDQVH